MHKNLKGKNEGKGRSGTKGAGQVIFSASHIGKKFELNEVLRDITFTVGRKERVGLVGPNGSGKSTLLKIIAGEIDKDSGVSQIFGDNKIEYLPQVHDGVTNESGGELAKKLLRPIMASDADLFILDEPTNNLDQDGLIMVENFIKKSDKAFLIVSHDRMFLDNIVTKIIEIDPKTKSSAIYEGNYSEYIAERRAKIERMWKEYNDKTEKLEKWSSLVAEKISYIREIEQTRHGIGKLPIHEKNKPQAAVLRDKEGRAGRRAKVMKNRLEKYQDQSQEIIKPQYGLPLKVIFENERGGTKVFDLLEVTKVMGETKIGPINLSIRYGDRLHLSGKNGSGKTTLLRMLLGEIQPDAGILERGENIKIGYISQERSLNRPDRSVIEEFLEVTKMPEGIARRLLNRFRITEEDVKKHLSLLSPGEYSRLLVAELVATKPNCIILDEPSNHLDLEVMEELENGLRDYEGTLIVVSHDRYFVNKVGLKIDYKLGKNLSEI